MAEGSQAELVGEREHLTDSVEQTTPIAPSGSPQVTASPINVGIASGLQFRIDERYEVEAEAEVIVKAGSLGTTMVRGNILDISATGCYIRTMARVLIKPGSEVHLIFSVGGTTFRLEAVSRFSRTKVGIGFRFLEMDTPTRTRLHGVLADIRTKLLQSGDHASVPVIDRTILE